MVQLVQWINKLIEEDKLWKFYKSKAFKDLRAEVFEEQHHECYFHRQRGQIVKGTICHHIYEVREYPQYALSKYVVDEKGNRHINLVCVCHRCHENICHPDRFKNKNKNKNKMKEIEERFPERW